MAFTSLSSSLHRNSPQERTITMVVTSRRILASSAHPGSLSRVLSW
ncbi:hypothetical protein OHT76_39100 [Streptomyces sp. NBC_00287]|nr:hypothetical protein [Streptomyces sp. NBC_00287]